MNSQKRISLKPNSTFRLNQIKLPYSTLGNCALSLPTRTVRSVDTAVARWMKPMLFLDILVGKYRQTAPVDPEGIGLFIWIFYDNYINVGIYVGLLMNIKNKMLFSLTQPLFCRWFCVMSPTTTFLGFKSFHSVFIYIYLTVSHLFIFRNGAVLVPLHLHFALVPVMSNSSLKVSCMAATLSLVRPEFPHGDQWASLKTETKIYLNNAHSQPRSHLELTRPVSRSCLMTQNLVSFFFSSIIQL